MIKFLRNLFKKENTDLKIKTLLPEENSVLSVKTVNNPLFYRSEPSSSEKKIQSEYNNIINLLEKFDIDQKKKESLFSMENKIKDTLHSSFPEENINEVKVEIFDENKEEFIDIDFDHKDYPFKKQDRKIIINYLRKEYAEFLKNVDFSESKETAMDLQESNKQVIFSKPGSFRRVGLKEIIDHERNILNLKKSSKKKPAKKVSSKKK